MRKNKLQQAYRLAQERYAALGVDTDKVLRALARVPVSLHCWQGDDVGGFENFGGCDSPAASSPPAITPAKRGRPTNCAPTPPRLSR